MSRLVSCQILASKGAGVSYVVATSSWLGRLAKVVRCLCDHILVRGSCFVEPHLGSEKAEDSCIDNCKKQKNNTKIAVNKMY